MAFDDLAPQPPIYPPEAKAYAREALELSRQAEKDVRLTADIPYGPLSIQKLDVHAPKDVGAPLPVLIFAHGGAWTHGYKEWMGLMAPPIVATPAIFVSIDYRLGPEFRYPDPVKDCISALAWILENISDYGGDPDRVYVGGHSAGAHLYSLAVHDRNLLRAGGVQPGSVRACLAVSGQMDLRFKDIPPGSSEERIHKTFLRDPSDARAASPRAYVDQYRVPMLLAIGSDDIPRIVRSNRAMARAVRRAGGKAELLELKGYDHFDTALNTRTPDNRWVRRARAWIKN